MFSLIRTFARNSEIKDSDMTIFIAIILFILLLIILLYVIQYKKRTERLEEDLKQFQIQADQQKKELEELQSRLSESIIKGRAKELIKERQLDVIIGEEKDRV